ncbi:hypothetical protein ACFE04_002746 [Oxalis oulophora]
MVGVEWGGAAWAEWSGRGMRDVEAEEKESNESVGGSSFVRAVSREHPPRPAAFPLPSRHDPVQPCTSSLLSAAGSVTTRSRYSQPGQLLRPTTTDPPAIPLPSRRPPSSASIEPAPSLITLDLTINGEQLL